MHAVCKTPRESRAELLEHTQCPDLEPMIYPPVVESEFDCASLGLRRLFQFWRAMDIEDDPYVRRLRKRPGSEEKLLKALDGKTYCQEQMKKFASRSAHISEELGPWAADYYIQASISQLTTSTSDSSIVSNWNGDEKAYLVNILSQIPLPAIQLDITPSEQVPISPKLKMLIDFLDRIYHPDFSGIIFVTQRVAVTVLVHLLSVHPLTKGRFRCAAYVGWSGNSNRKECIGDLHHLRSQRDTLNDFRSGRKNLIVSTDVLEEGIDISACRLVICFDKPPNLKSFVQRRGRARQKKSTYAIMLASNDKSANLDALQSLEETMIQAYQDEKRRLRQELEPEEDEEVVDDQLRVESTG